MELRKKKMHLTHRELEIIILISNGFQNKEIANTLGISRRTAETYIRRIYIKIGARNRSNAASIFIKKLNSSIFCV